MQPPKTSRRHCTKFSRPRPGAQDLCIRAILDAVSILLHNPDALTLWEWVPGSQLTEAGWAPEPVWTLWGAQQQPLPQPVQLLYRINSVFPKDPIQFYPPTYNSARPSEKKNCRNLSTASTPTVSAYLNPLFKYQNCTWRFVLHHFTTSPLLHLLWV